MSQFDRTVASRSLSITYIEWCRTQAWWASWWFTIATAAKEQQNDKTADLVKRRYSTRFTQAPPGLGDGAPPPLPSVPTIPSQFAGPNPPVSRDGGGRPEGKGAIQLDNRMLRDPNLRPEAVVKNLLADASPEDILDFQQRLQKMKNRASTDLQHNVYQNRTQFIRISHEAEKLKGELRGLRGLMTELTGALGQATSAGSTNEETITVNKRANRSSVANLEALWGSQLQTLWKRIEGSQKFLPAIPGRHVIYESGRWIELNAATLKPRRRVHIILLNDHLLTASEKKRTEASPQDPRKQQNQIPVQLVAQHCWPLQDVRIEDSPLRSATRGADGDSRNSSTAISVRVGSETFTYTTSGADSAEKASLLTTYRKASEDLRKTLEAETEQRSKARNSGSFNLAAQDQTYLRASSFLESLSDDPASSRGSLFVDVDGKQQSIRWIYSQLDDLDIDIALQRFEEAVARVEKLRRLAHGIKSNALAQEVIMAKVNERAGKLAGSLTRQLVETHAWITSTQQNVDWLVRLGFDDKAREAYLEARSAVLRKRTRQCIFDGDLPSYIYQLSYIYFNIIKNTVSIYQTCFPQPMMSACVKWAKEQVEEFNAILHRQLSSVDPQSQTWRDCLDQAHQHAAVLGGVGLDFKNLIGQDVQSDGTVGLDGISRAAGALGIY